ncbi:MAG: HAD-IB family hydrolase [Rhodococcus sp. (in: high G+C Gram-positive bacteria)]|uniref:HAD-IB family hydrolase n=1 Tax=Rhodococcus sp. TaxID=1831 RepID=UPI003BAF533F
MSDVRSLHDAVAAAPPGAATLAVFDLDGTLINGYSASVVYRDRLRRFDISIAELLATTGAALDTRLRGSDISRLMRIAVQSLAGRMEDEMQEWGQRLFRQEIAGLIYPEVRGLLAAHRHAGHRIVMATSATPYQAQSVANDLDIDIDDILCTRPEVVDGMLTGRLESPPLWGPAKAQAVREYAERVGADLADSFAYSNGTEDIPMLESVGHPVALNPDRRLAATARRNGWPSADLRPLQRGSDPLSIARTATAIGTLLATTAVGVSAGILTGNRQTGANLVGTFGPDLALAVCGIRLHVTGEENAWSSRPAVFMFNHQSSLDLLIIGSVIRRDVTGVAKKEAARDPRFLPIGALLDVAYVDRADSAKARAALRPAVDKLHSGVSIAIAPEGTRSPTPRLGRFKKGGFHLALQAGVPIVPIVIHNAGERMWRNSLVAHPGPVYVDILEPVPTEGWKVSDLDRHIEDVRTLFEDCLRAGHR